VPSEVDFFKENRAISGFSSRTEGNEMQPSVVIMLTLALVTLVATSAKVCFRLMAEAETQQVEGHVDDLKRESR